ncbi:hypothetical protein [Neolewinella sp.]|uniref:hypothetical protein n=1 Tax=Neolewinella sp. TaxID=2993543 RepID=UPI003B518E1E
MKTAYQHPGERANSTALHLRTRQHYDLLVCLSDLGYRYQDDKVSDVTLAAASRHIDLIPGGGARRCIACSNLRV